MTTDPARSNLVDKGLTPLQTPTFYDLKLQRDISLGDFVFNTIDEYGVIWVVTNIEGWWNHPGVEMPDIKRGWGDGSYDIKGRYNARDLTLEGVFLVSNPSLVEAARDRLVEATDLVYKGAWLKTGSNPIRASWVRLSGGVEIETTNARGRTSFSVQLKAFDPIKYLWNDEDEEGYSSVDIPVFNSSVSGSGSAVITNVGNYTVPTKLEITGPLVGPATVTNTTTGQTLTILKSLRGSTGVTVSTKQLTFSTSTLRETATLTTESAHGFIAGNEIYISGIGSPFDGLQTVLTTPNSTTFTYTPALQATIRDVISKQLSAGVATLETTINHGFGAGDEILIDGVDSVFNGSYTIASTPTTKTFTYNRTRVPVRSVIARQLVSNVATLTTSEPHGFVVGETATITGVDVNFNGSRVITSIPTTTTFTYVTTRTTPKEITNKAMTANVVTLNTPTDHGFFANETVTISSVDQTLNGSYTIASVPTSTSFTYERTRTTDNTVTIKSLTSNVATLTLSSAHNYSVGETVIVAGVDATFNGEYVVTALPSSTTFSYAKTNANIIATATSGSTRCVVRLVTSSQLSSNVVTLTTTNDHGIVLGEQVTVSGVGATYNGTYEVTSVPTSTTFTYTKINADVALQTGLTGATVSLPGTIASQVVSGGQATVSGNITYAGASGSASVSSTVALSATSGKAIRTQGISTSSVVSGTAVLGADVLTIDTQNRETSLNGVREGSRNIIEPLAEFIDLQPGDNTIEFSDSGAVQGTSNLRVLYRSGWLS